MTAQAATAIAATHNPRPAIKRPERFFRRRKRRYNARAELSSPGRRLEGQKVLLPSAIHPPPALAKSQSLIYGAGDKPPRHTLFPSSCLSLSRERCNGARKHGGRKVKVKRNFRTPSKRSFSLCLRPDPRPGNQAPSSYLQPPQLGEEASPERDLEALGEVPGHEREELQVEGLGEPARRPIRLQQVS